METLIVIGDTHCNFEILHSLYEKESLESKPLGLLHCGDIGIYDSENLDRLPQKEKRLIEKHGDSVEQFLPYLKKERQFPVQVFGIAGNHEDFELFHDIAENQVVIESLDLCSYRGGIRQFKLGKKEYRVFGFGKILPHNSNSEKNRQKPSIITTEELKAAFSAVKKYRPDILLLHEPPRLPFPESSGRKGYFGSFEITKLIQASGARMAFIGHMHFEYETMIGNTKVYGLGYGEVGRYGTLDENGEFVFKRLWDPRDRKKELEIVNMGKYPIV